VEGEQPIGLQGDQSMTPLSCVQENSPGGAFAEAFQYGGRRQVEAGRKSSEETDDFTIVGDVEARSSHRSHLGHGAEGQRSLQEKGHIRVFKIYVPRTILLTFSA